MTNTSTNAATLLDDDHLMTTLEVATMLRAPASTVRYWRFAGSGPASFRLGRRVVYRRSEVLRWVQAKEQEEPRTAGSPTGSGRRPRRR